MLNLSDKELDRLAREAANEYDPGDPTGPGSWDRMHLRLDIEMGYPRLNFFRSIRRMSFYYAPAILLLAGASWFLFRSSSRSHPATHPPGSPATARTEPSGSPPRTKIAPIQPPQANPDRSIEDQNNTHSLTSTQTSPTSASGATIPSRAEQGTSSGQSAPPRQLAPSNQLAPSGQLVPSGQLASSGRSAPPRQSRSGLFTQPRLLAPSAQPGSPQQLPAGTLSPSGQSTPFRNSGPHPKSNPGSAGRSAGSSGSTDASSGNPGSLPGSGTDASDQTSAASGDEPRTGAGLNSSFKGIPARPNSTAAPAPLSYSIVSGIRPNLPPNQSIDDSALRKLSSASTAKTAEPVNPGKPASHSLHIDRRLQIGVSLAPDFSSVNSLAGDKPGSDIGITASYQFFSRWHLQTGFLLSHRNYTAAQEDYHVPYDYYRMNNMHDVYYVKGNLNLFEIPLNLRYDFSISGNTYFFVSGGVSSYLLTHEDCNYYFDLFGRTVYQEFKYGAHQNSLFGTVNLSMGVETGLSNNLSLLIAPFMKMPTSGLGFGRIEMNSVGVEFGLKYAPVLRRKRR